MADPIDSSHCKQAVTRPIYPCPSSFPQSIKVSITSSTAFELILPLSHSPIFLELLTGASHIPSTMLILTIVLVLSSALISATPTPGITEVIPHLVHLPDANIPGETAGTMKLQDGGFFTLYAEYSPGTWDQFKSPIKEYWLKMGHIHYDFHRCVPNLI